MLKAPGRGRPWWASPWLGLLLVVLVAACLRYPGLDHLPPGLNFDEGGEGIAALDVLNGHLRLWWPIGGGKEPLMAYLVQPFFWLLGPTRLALRWYSATMGVLAAVGTYWLAWELVGHRRRHWLVPLVAGLGLATAFWHVAYSRIGFRALAMPAVEAIALAWLWRALRTGRWYHFVGAGCFIGLGAYTYLAGRFVPVGLALFFLLEALMAWRQARPPLLVRHWWGLLLTLLSALVVFSPLGVFFVTHPERFVERAGSVSIFSPEMNHGNLLGTLVHTSLSTLGTWAGLSGDPNPLGNVAGMSMLDLPLAPLFWLGLLVCLYLVVRRLLPVRPSAAPVPPTHRSLILPAQPWLPAAYLFLVCMWAVMLLPGILAPEGAPHHLRLIGTAPLTYLLVGIGVSRLVNLGVIVLGGSPADETRSHKPGQRRPIGRWNPWLRSPLLPLLLFVPIGAVTAGTYLTHWARQSDLYMAFDVYAVELGQQMAADDQPGVVYVIPMDLRAGHEARHYSLDFLYHGQAPYVYLPVDETTAAGILTEAAAGHDRLRLVRWLQDKHAAADERQLVTFLLTTAGARLESQRDYPVYRVETWRLPSTETKFSLPVINTPISADFDGLLRLNAFSVQAVDGQVAVALSWQPLAPMQVDYKASLRLTDAAGNRVAQVDRFLRHNWHQGTSLWPDEVVNEYYLLPAPAPGEYRLSVVVYDPDTLAPLTSAGLAEVALGSVQVK